MGKRIELSADAKAWIERQEQEFMRPSVEFLTEAEAPDDEDGESLGPGYYSRLSAPGYLDATDWHGPYDQPEEALEALYEIYGEDDFDPALEIEIEDAE